MICPLVSTTSTRPCTVYSTSFYSLSSAPESCNVAFETASSPCPGRSESMMTPVGPVAPTVEVEALTGATATLVEGIVPVLYYTSIEIDLPVLRSLHRMF